MHRIFDRAFSDAAQALASFRADPEIQSSLLEIAEALTEVLRKRGRVLVCGNGGSLADAMHFAEEWSGRFRGDRPAYPVLALSDPTHLTCVANDFGFEHVFSRQVEAFGHEGDLLIVLSTSGHSANIVEAAEAGRRRGMRVVGFLGKGGGRVRGLCDWCIVAPGETSDRIQELHMLALHVLIEVVEEALGHGA
ncbi:MAG: SIS domain-containing protein [Fimbriimonadaceae bacterium]|nr:SIS domain-containing protein [Chthonomonadaceae bacterium]MCO5295622.1 SIS domain-containing protein [Fimbriimonadaceae bacterium]